MPNALFCKYKGQASPSSRARTGLCPRFDEKFAMKRHSRHPKLGSNQHNKLVNSGSLNSMAANTMHYNTAAVYKRARSEGMSGKPKFGLDSMVEIRLLKTEPSKSLTSIQTVFR